MDGSGLSGKELAVAAREGKAMKKEKATVAAVADNRLQLISYHNPAERQKEILRMPRKYVVPMVALERSSISTNRKGRE